MSSTDFTPIYVRIERYIRDAINSGRLAEGARVPSEPELARDFSTTRATVARALQQLVFDGAVVRRPGSGTFVAPRAVSAPLDPTRVRSFEEQLAAKGVPITYSVLSFEPREPTDTERTTLHLDAGENVYALERLRLVSGRKFSVERRVISSELGTHITRVMLENYSIHRILEEHLRLKVHRVEGRIRAGLAKADIARHLDIRPGRPVLIRDYTLFTQDRRPLLSGESYYREDFQIDYLVQQSDED